MKKKGNMKKKRKMRKIKKKWKKMKKMKKKIHTQNLRRFPGLPLLL